MEASLRFYVDGLGFAMTRKWVVDGKLRWCWLELGDAAVMLQEFRREGHDSFSPRGPVGEGVASISPAWTRSRCIASFNRAD